MIQIKKARNFRFGTSNVPLKHVVLRSGIDARPARDAGEAMLLELVKLPRQAARASDAAWSVSSRTGTLRA
ncbi:MULTISPECIES: hypothetical protein [unclassified Bradyrhizobium]|uniref:hypothetical protein n=1 Tax=unclassified Bradyrhizobium TaxID=2631580 RepID=UPI00041CEC1F|nr:MULTISPECIES: hypothetical protein [unclassified Bradyrhizobium]QIG98691.1 hypothetical protein G6P99_45195 [Bradyrhizobium sp. 6(2017)]